MAGAIVHIAVGLLTAALLQYYSRTEFAIAIFIGNLLPDALKFGVAAIAQGTIAIFQIEHDVLYQALGEVTSSVSYWIIMLVFVIAAAFQLYHHGVIREKEMEEIDEVFGYLILGILIHLAIDVFIHEGGPWI